MKNLVVFDLDGVITNEEAYWDTAGLTLHELCYSPCYWNLGSGNLGADGQYYPVATAEESRSTSRAILPEAEILAIKARAINSNWDSCYVAACLSLIDLLALVPNLQSLLPLQPWDAEWLAAFRKQGVQLKLPRESPLYVKRLDQYRERGSAGTNHTQYVSSLFDMPIFEGYVGLALINRFDLYASQQLGYPIEDVFSRYSPFWAFCRDIFQEWYLGDNLYASTYGHLSKQQGKPGCIHFEQPLLPLEVVRSTLETLQRQDYVVGFATGRTSQEALYPLEMYGLRRYFDEEHIATYDDVERAEAVLRARGNHTLLGKPHPFQFLIAVDHSDQNFNRLLEYMEPLETTLLEDPGAPEPSPAKNESFVVVGDSTSDMLGGRAAGAITVAVLTGARTAEARQLLEQSRPDFTIEDMTRLPKLLEEIDSLATIQRLQFSEKEKAERLLRRWFTRHMQLHSESVNLMPKAVSLNSFNGFYSLNGVEYFFKTHVEEQGILSEYYQADLLHQAGYNIVKPLKALHEGGRQMVIYPVVRWPVVFDLARTIEVGSAEDDAFETVIAAEKRECARLLSIYDQTMMRSSAQEYARAPIHQLFWHRLAGERFKSFYQGKVVTLPGQGKFGNVQEIPFEELLQYRWTINNTYGTVVTGKWKRPTLGELIERARIVLDPAREMATVIGHGDAHFGNVFLENRKDFLYFDPAFAGRHSPLLDIVKPFFHNVFATWMYFPGEVAQNLQISVEIQGSDIYVEHDFELTMIRKAIFETKLQALYAPLKEMLSARKDLPADWSEMVWLAMMCCPLLTMNLLDVKRLPSALCWLGLAQAIEMGNRSLNEG
ncbi:MAG: hypothetical protein E6I91_07930 [Chloroflexi bacterium]|nr:MAG: hypothetical protein E6I91_07930 [Chloroflexota bacterium]